MTKFQLDEIVQINNSFEVQWYADRRLVVYVPKDIDFSVLELWSDTVFETISKWRSGYPYLAIHDISHRGVTIPYLALVKNRILNMSIHPDRESELIDLVGNLENRKFHIAICLPRTMSGHMGKLFANLQEANSRDNSVEFKMFLDQTEALEWLEEYMLD